MVKKLRNRLFNRKDPSTGSGKRLLTERGVSLVEMLVAVFVGVLVLTVTMIIEVMGKQTVDIGSAFLEVHSSARMAMDWMDRDIRGASQIVPSRVVNGNNYFSTTDQLILQLPSIDANNQIINDTYDYIVYHLIDSTPVQLERIVDAHANSSRPSESRIMARNVDDFSLSSGGTPLAGVGDVTTLTHVTVHLDLHKEAMLGQDVDETLDLVVKLRNK